MTLWRSDCGYGPEPEGESINIQVGTAGPRECGTDPLSSYKSSDCSSNNVILGDRSSHGLLLLVGAPTDQGRTLHNQSTQLRHQLANIHPRHCDRNSSQIATVYLTNVVKQKYLAQSSLVPHKLPHEHQLLKNIPRANPLVQ